MARSNVASLAVRAWVLVLAGFSAVDLAGSASAADKALGEPMEWTDAESPLISSVKQITSETMGIRRAGEGYFSPESPLMIFQAEKDPANPFFQIFTMDLASGEVRQVSPGVGKTTCSFFRPGTDEVIFASSHLDPEALEKQKADLAARLSGERPQRGAWDYEPHMDIFLSRRDGTGLKRLTEEFGYDAEASVSPDGSKIVFCSTRSAYPIDSLSAERKALAEKNVEIFGEIYIMDANGKNVKRLTDWDGYDGGPFFSPDGNRIVWRHFDVSGEIAEVYTMKTDGSDRRQITDLGAMSWAPYFHPTGEYIIFTTNVHGHRNFELYMVDARGDREAVRVTTREGFDGLPVFMPDGRLCWTASWAPGTQGQLYMANWDHEKAKKAIAASPAREMKAER
jgi:Tol biopolymer transport system component